MIMIYKFSDSSLPSSCLPTKQTQKIWASFAHKGKSTRKLITKKKNYIFVIPISGPWLIQWFLEVRFKEMIKYQEEKKINDLFSSTNLRNLHFSSVLGVQEAGKVRQEIEIEVGKKRIKNHIFRFLWITKTKQQQKQKIWRKIFQIQRRLSSKLKIYNYTKKKKRSQNTVWEYFVRRKSKNNNIHVMS